LTQRGFVQETLTSRARSADLAPRRSLLPAFEAVCARFGHSACVTDRFTDDTRIFHIAFESEWNAAKRGGTYRGSTRGADLDEVGFIHASFENQIARVGEGLYEDAPEPLVVLAIDPDLLDASVVVENLEGGDEGFPHIYGPLPIGAVIAVQRATVTDGHFVIEAGGDT
jgi:uncharacterized protein (DUF952 family)